MVHSMLRFSFARPDPDPVEQSGVFRAALEMVRWADTQGVDSFTVDEHHVTGFGWSANPILEAGCFLAATSRMTAWVACVLGPLWNPIRLAEDIAIVDQLSGGRLMVTVGLGYRPIEYAAIDVDFERRGRLLDNVLETVLKAWSGAPFEYNGTTIAVTPVPLTKPTPHLSVGGAVRATARRAVRFGLPLDIPKPAPEIKAYYEQLCAESGVEPRVRMATLDNLPAVFVHEDPERAWAQLGQHFAWEAIEYGKWATSDMGSVMHLHGVQTLDEVRRSNTYLIISPDDLVDLLASRGPDATMNLYPLCGGMPIDEGWKSLHLLTDNVLPRLRARAEGVSGDAPSRPGS